VKGEKEKIGLRDSGLTNEGRHVTRLEEVGRKRSRWTPSDPGIAKAILLLERQAAPAGVEGGHPVAGLTEGVGHLRAGGQRDIALLGVSSHEDHDPQSI
jgi:hypothetical protein